MNSKLLPALALAAGVGAFSPAGAAVIYWNLENVSFDDGGTASGTIKTTPYAYGVASSTAGAFSNGTGGPLAADSYNSTLFNWSQNFATHTVTMYSAVHGYVDQLTLKFKYDLATAIADNPIVSGYECHGWDCPNTTAIRSVVSGYAAAPEAPTWAMMMLGGGLLAYGSMLGKRVRRKAI